MFVLSIYIQQAQYILQFNPNMEECHENIKKEGHENEKTPGKTMKVGVRIINRWMGGLYGKKNKLRGREGHRKYM